ncbi:2-succinyl-5-enolpyruvyl-6-hydroxy-3-cyclohexene-1-carboxylic-acid synthase [Rubrobacter calidifluminis]|uniref:2-succinyl-5-enolpyruvyl-6-hydroxy-3- cyclohexene-1-carboxylic-acid synthase n=1 Tax=Rubrobacter calidifluminis TaxID=1392640 RepID=UPI00235FE817|nr:2-succinyl-5-enolpyruvyl-6-hydroxy-3-cyclohexene-1-carboxylic-acid synthase [Rubrobacter calidifluminis]
MDLPAEEANILWSSLLVEELVRAGVGLFCIAPGSRSTPLVAAIAENPRARAVVHYDERGAAFCALGHARATGRPAAWVTTSGTAAANGLPAVVEAATDCVPMLLLTADRPPELRETGANQTIVQPGLFGGYVRWSFDMPAPDTRPTPEMVLTAADQAVYRSRRSPSGPVHLNLMFREPFLPPPGRRPEVPPHLRGWYEKGAPYTRYAGGVSSAEGVGDLWEELRGVERGIVVAGRLGSRREGEAVLDLAGELGWPLLPDVVSQLRLGGKGGTLVPYYDLLLADEDFVRGSRPDAILQFGGGPVSKRLQRFLERAKPGVRAVVHESPFRLDPEHAASHRFEAAVGEFCVALRREVRERPGKPDPAWTERWVSASEEIGRRLAGGFSGDQELSEPLVARLVTRHIPAGHALCLASSMPVRDVDAFGVAEGEPVPVFANRGASGIDGTVATAAGYAGGTGRPVTLLIGDLALLHDLNSLALIRGLPVTVVVVNNGGGGIFSMLPVARQKKNLFERYFGTPHGLTFESASAMFGLRYERPATVEEFVEAYRKACSGEDPSLLEVRTDRAENAALHERIVRELSR